MDVRSRTVKHVKTCYVAVMATIPPAAPAMEWMIESLVILICLQGECSFGGLCSKGTVMSEDLTVRFPPGSHLSEPANILSHDVLPSFSPCD